MKAKRRRHDSAFKARVALEAMKEDKTIHQIAKENDVHPTQVTEWKKMLAENIAGVFEGSKRAGKEDFEIEGVGPTYSHILQPFCLNLEFCPYFAICSQKLTKNAGLPQRGFLKNWNQKMLAAIAESLKLHI